MELKPSKYIPTVEEDTFGIKINGVVLQHVEKDMKTFLSSVGVRLSDFFPNNTTTKADFKKQMNKALFDELGMSPRALHSWATKLWYKHNVVDVKQFERLFRKKTINTEKLKSVKKNRHLLEQAILDGQHNLLPILNVTGKTPTMLRETFGKGVWKGLCANSFSRNMLIAERIGASYLSLSGVALVKFLQTVPSSLLKHPHVFVETMPFIMNSLKGSWGDYAEVRKWNLYVRETKAMAEKLSEPFNMLWSKRRMKEEHDRLVAHELAKKYSKDVFPVFSVGPLQVPLVFEASNGLVAHLLMSPYDMKMEGETQRHCVAGYSEEVGRGKYLVYSVRDVDGNRKSTIGINKKAILYTTNIYPSTAVEIPCKWEVQQHYAACNRSPSEECNVVEEELMGLFSERGI